jgi:hypothetical protein
MACCGAVERNRYGFEKNYNAKELLELVLTTAVPKQCRKYFANIMPHK